MKRNVVAVVYTPWRKSFVVDKGGAFARVAGRYKKAVFSKANPRREDYMLQLLADEYPSCSVLRFEDSESKTALRKADVVLLLYPDAIGQGFGPVERDIQRTIPSWAEVRALNGRRRNFLLNRTTLWSLRLRRFLERTMLIELCITIAFLVTTPILLAVDWTRGRR